MRFSSAVPRLLQSKPRNRRPLIWRFGFNRGLLVALVCDFENERACVVRMPSQGDQRTARQYDDPPLTTLVARSRFPDAVLYSVCWCFFFVTSWQASLLLAIFGLFQPYPTMADPMLAGCLFLCHPRTSARMRLVIPVGMAALVPSLLLPTMRHLWLQAGTGNANFYYFQTVALNVLLAVFVLQFAAALVKRRKALAVAFERRRKAGTTGEADAGDGANETER